MSDDNGVGILGIAGMFILIPIIALVYDAFTEDPEGPTDFGRINDNITDFHDKNGRLPNDKEGNAIIKEVSPDAYKEMRYKREDIGWAFITAGRDEEFGTPDDYPFTRYEITTDDDNIVTSDDIPEITVNEDR
jgi:hypothetical protein